uniref:Bacteriophage T4 Gp32 single-stranded DNA-binding domain-containing protein n=1 Tax=Dulem virus 36 TaxID=3145754 RepID=A0AAU8B0Z5_9CAUD
MGKITLDAIKREINNSGANRGKLLYFKEGTKVRVRFLTDMEDGLQLLFHNNYKENINVPCQEVFNRECPYCEDDSEGMKHKNMYAWSVYDYESKEVKILLSAVNHCTPIPALAGFYETYGTLTDRDYEIKQMGKGTSKTFSVIPLDVRKMRDTKVKPLSESAMLKLIDKAFPVDNYEMDSKDEEVDDLKGKMNEPEDEWEEENEYESMKPIELYKLCKERGIKVKAKMSKKYYIDFLEEYDENNDELEDEWEE